ncbi:nucleobase:cation symporter-2 family protein [Pelosinus sp. IPA-1]|uniref:nucleobase:cation symporter-2 family protein n=1 Tax=Pelosinus sp. IPA-1 TaxID=3029569 RepID=UPI0024362088|nr:nucleobase:cation symporter-2 family protein [Pelosinus sp. IPA-1]GMB00563.1 uracil permease [Pelosinus sp. IPA-1]
MAQDRCHPVDEMLPVGQLFTYGLQHVLAMYAGAVAVPLIIANALGLSKEQLIFLINADLFTCGIATLIQTIGFWNMGIRIPMVQGVTFAAVTPMIIIGQTHGIPAIYGSIIVAGAVTYFISPYFSRLIRFFPPVVTGSIITIIGISLMPVAVRWAGGGNPAAKDFASMEYIGLALFVLLLVLAFYRYFKGFMSNIAVLLGLIAGTVIAFFMGMVNLEQVSQSGWISVTTPFWFGVPTFDLASIAAMVLVMLVVMTETTGDCIAIGEIVDKPISENDLTRCLRADGFSTMLGGILNSFPYTAFAQNVGLVGLTRVRSRFVVAAAGVILIILGMFPKLAAVIAAIPNPVLGGAGVAMFGMVAASGIRTLAKIDFNGTHNIMVVGISLGLGMITLAVPNFYHNFPSWLQVILHSGITTGSIAAIVLNLVLNGTQNNSVIIKKSVRN